MTVYDLVHTFIHRRVVVLWGTSENFPFAFSRNPRESTKLQNQELIIDSQLFVHYTTVDVNKFD